VAKSPVLVVAHFDPAERARLSALFEAFGAKVHVAADGPSAAALAQKHPVDLVVASCMLPTLSGFELCRTLLVPDDARGAVATVLLADADDPYVRARARHVGAKRVLVGAPTEIDAKSLVEGDWKKVDPLEISSRQGGTSRNDRLIRDLLDGKPDAEESVMAKVTDPLTGLVQRDYLRLKVEEECKRSARYGQPLSLLAAEVASFDQLVEKHGKALGEEALTELAGVFLCESRDVDVAGRAGPARFHMLLPATPLEGARIAANRIFESLSGRTLQAGAHEIPLQVRIGVAVVPGGTKQTADGLVREAEADLASAQLGGDGRGIQLRGGTPVEPLPAKKRDKSSAK